MVFRNQGAWRPRGRGFCRWVSGVFRAYARVAPQTSESHHSDVCLRWTGHGACCLFLSPRCTHRTMQVFTRSTSMDGRQFGYFLSSRAVYFHDLGMDGLVCSSSAASSAFGPCTWYAWHFVGASCEHQCIYLMFFVSLAYLIKGQCVRYASGQSAYMEPVHRVGCGVVYASDCILRPPRIARLAWRRDWLICPCDLGLPALP